MVTTNVAVNKERFHDLERAYMKLKKVFANNHSLCNNIMY